MWWGVLWFALLWWLAVALLPPRALRVFGWTCIFISVSLFALILAQ